MNARGIGLIIIAFCILSGLIAPIFISIALSTSAPTPLPVPEIAPSARPVPALALPGAWKWLEALS